MAKFVYVCLNIFVPDGNNIFLYLREFENKNKIYFLILEQQR